MSVSVLKKCQPLIDDPTTTNVFNDEKSSDMKVVFPISNHVLHLHRVIICQSSEFFEACLRHEMKESNDGGIVTMSDDDDEDLMTVLLKSCYSLQIEFPSDNTRIVPMVQLAHKYQFNALLLDLISYLLRNIDVKTNILHCLHLLDNDDWCNDEQWKDLKLKLHIEMQNSTKDILTGESYLTLDIDLWKRAIQLMINCENRLHFGDAIQAWVSFDPDNRGVYHSELMDMVSSAVDVKPNTTFDPAYCGTRATLSSDNKRVVCRGYGWHCSAMGTRCAQYSIRLIQNGRCLMVGMAPKASFKKDGYNHNSCGWYLFSLNGTIQHDHKNRQYANQACHMDGTVIGVQLENGELSFSVNGVNKGVAFRGLPDDVYPAFDMFDDNCEFEFI